MTHLIFSDERYDLYYTCGAYDWISALTLKDANGQVLTQFGYDFTNPSTLVSALVNGSLVNFATTTIGTGSLIAEKQFANGLDLKYTYDPLARVLRPPLTRHIPIHPRSKKEIMYPQASLVGGFQAVNYADRRNVVFQCGVS